MGQAIYKPKGRAGEYSEWACNFYVGCSNGCEYCYLKSGRGAEILGGDEPTLKKCFKDENHALKVFEKELVRNIDELQKHGLFFSFTTDPMLPETKELSYHAWGIALHMYDIPVKILTKRADWVEPYLMFMDESNSDNASREWRKKLAFGFTLTGHDEVEPNASPNIDRIEAMVTLHDAGFRTFASIEPVIDFSSSLQMIDRASPFCDLFKIGLKAGDKHHYDLVRSFMDDVLDILETQKIYFKDSLLKQAAVRRDELPENCVGRDYNMFLEE